MLSTRSRAKIERPSRVCATFIGLLSLILTASQTKATSFVSTEVPVSVFDFPPAGAQAALDVNGLGSGIIASITVYTQFTLVVTSRITLVLTPPGGSGVGPITLIDDTSPLSSGTYATHGLPRAPRSLQP